MGSSPASAVCLRAIMRERELEVVGVVSQPDRPVGRGKVVTPCPLKAFAVESGITEIVTPEDVNACESLDRIRAWRPDAIAVVAFGQFLKKPLLDLPPLGCFNCHFSLLPKYRGASPVVAAIAAGDKLTGVSVIKMGIGMDDGPVLLQSYEPIYSDATGGSLMDTLAVAGGVTLAKALCLLAAGKLGDGVKQHGEDATFARKLRKTDGAIAWSDPVLTIERKIRAYLPWPGCHTFLPARLRKKGNSGRVSIGAARIASCLEPEWKDAEPGTVLACGREGPTVKCLDTAIVLTKLKPEGGSMMDGGAFLRGRPIVPLSDKFENQ